MRRLLEVKDFVDRQSPRLAKPFAALSALEGLFFAMNVPAKQNEKLKRTTTKRYDERENRRTTESPSMCPTNRFVIVFCRRVPTVLARHSLTDPNKIEEKNNLS